MNSPASVDSLLLRAGVKLSVASWFDLEDSNSPAVLSTVSGRTSIRGETIIVQGFNSLHSRAFVDAIVMTKV